MLQEMNERNKGKISVQKCTPVGLTSGKGPFLERVYSLDLQIKISAIRPNNVTKMVTVLHAQHSNAYK